jgi:hypothetical protein
MPAARKNVHSAVLTETPPRMLKRQRKTHSAPQIARLVMRGAVPAMKNAAPKTHSATPRNAREKRPETQREQQSSATETQREMLGAQKNGPESAQERQIPAQARLFPPCRSALPLLARQRAAQARPRPQRAHAEAAPAQRAGPSPQDQSLIPQAKDMKDLFWIFGAVKR